MDWDWTFAADCISLDTLSLASACVPSFPEMSPMDAIICFMDAIKRSTLRLISAISSLPLLLTDTVKSPSVSALMTFVSFRTGAITTCVVRSITTHRIRMEITLIRIIRFLRFARSASTVLVGI